MLDHGRRPRLHLAAAPPDVLMQSAIVLRSLGAAVTRLDLDTGTLEARLAAGGILRLSAEPAADGSHAVIEVAGRDWGRVARLLARELAHGGCA
jgi:hypothetical protein